MVDLDRDAEESEFDGGVDGVKFQPVSDAGSRYEILFVDQLLSLPTPKWQIRSILPRERLIVLYGPSGCGKSFIALSWAFAIAAGQNWFNYEVEQGLVLYIAAEGFFGTKLRLQAWIQGHGQSARDGLYSNFAVVGDAVPLLEADGVDELLAAIATLLVPPALLVIDTLARCMAGGDENSARDMGLFVAACDRIKRETGATVLVVHHAGKDARSERGSSALRAAADCVMRLDKVDGVLTLAGEKQKDAEDLAPEWFRLQAVEVGVDEDGFPVTSCYLVSSPPPSGAEPRKRDGRGNDGKAAAKAKIVAALQEGFFAEGAAWTALMEVSGIKKPTFHRHLRELCDEWEVSKLKVGAHPRYFLPSYPLSAAPVSVSVSPGLRDSGETGFGQPSSSSLSLTAPLKGGETAETETATVVGELEGAGEHPSPQPEDPPPRAPKRKRRAPQAASSKDSRRRARVRSGRGTPSSASRPAPEVTPKPEKGGADA